jgi:hypothetical protein
VLATEPATSTPASSPTDGSEWCWPARRPAGEPTSGTGARAACGRAADAAAGALVSASASREGQGRRHREGGVRPRRFATTAVSRPSPRRHAKPVLQF